MQMILSKKQKGFSGFFATSLKSTTHFKHFEQKDESHSLCISEIVECERLGYLNV